MRKNPIILNSKDRKSLETIYTNWKNQNGNRAKKIALKIKVILLRDDDKPIDYIIKETGLSKRTIINYTKNYLDDDRFFVRKENKCKSILETKNVKNIFPSDAPPLSYREAKERILKEFNIDISIIQVRNYLNKNKIFTSRSNHKLNYNKSRKLKSRTKKYKERISLKTI